MRSGFYRTSCEDQLSGWMEKKLQSTSQRQTCTKKKKDMVTVWRFAAGLTHYSFLNSSKTITSEKSVQQVNEMQQKSAAPAASISQQKGPSSSP